MKSLSALVLLGLVSTACSSFKTAEYVPVEAERTIAQAYDREGVSFSRVEEGKPVKLERCGGVAKLVRAQDGLTLQVRKANCSNVKTSKGTWKLHGTGNTDRWIDVVFDESVPGDKMVLIGSNAYIDSYGAEGNGDYLTVKVPAKRVTLDLTRSTESREIKLQHCNGSIRAAVSNGRVTINVTNTGCSKFDILSNSGEAIKYEVKAIPEVSIQAGYSGNFTIPDKFYDRGLNGVVVRLLSPRLVEELVLVKFRAW